MLWPGPGVCSALLSKMRLASWQDGRTLSDYNIQKATQSQCNRKNKHIDVFRIRPDKAYMPIKQSGALKPMAQKITGT